MTKQNKYTESLKLYLRNLIICPMFKQISQSVTLMKQKCDIYYLASSCSLVN